MKSYRLTEVKSYNVPFVRLPRPVFWFNDPFEAGTWSDLLPSCAQTGKKWRKKET